MTDASPSKDQTPSLKAVVGALLLASRQPLNPSQIRNTLKSTAGTYGEQAGALEKNGEKAVRAAIEELAKELEESGLGMRIVEVANGFRLQNDPACGLWLRQMLDRGKPQRLSKPALETLAVIAYRQPCTRSEVESVRGVSVDAMVRTLLEMGLIKVTGRSELPGRPWLFGSTSKFLEHFGINQIAELPGAEELRRREEQKDVVAPDADNEDTPEPVEDEAPPIAAEESTAEEVAPTDSEELAPEGEDEPDDEEEDEFDEDDDDDEDEEA